MLKFFICNNFLCLNWNCLKIGIFAQGSYSLNSTSDSLPFRDTVRKMIKVWFRKEIQNAYSGSNLNICTKIKIWRVFQAWNSIILKLWPFKIGQILILYNADRKYEKIAIMTCLWIWFGVLTMLWCEQYLPTSCR